MIILPTLNYSKNWLANIYRMNFYLLYKSLHLIAVISWMAGLLYLPRIFVYHSEANHESQKKVFKIMERKLYNFIMMPAMLLSWLFGVLLLHSLGFSVFSELWMQIKIFAVIVLSLIHIWRCRRSTLCRSRWSPYH